MGAFRTRGHPGALAAVHRYVVTEKPPHALLLVGPPGVGKTTLALDLAAGLLCLDDDATLRPCGACAACRKVEHGNHPDLHVLRPEGAGEQVRLAQVQQLATDLALLPMEGRWRFCLIEAAHRLNPDAQNAMLKTLEEPVGAACIVLAADDAATLLPTVTSRTARLRLGPVDQRAIVGLLDDRGLADAPRAALIARAAGGRPGVAIALAEDAEAMLAAQRLARSIVDLAFADRRARLAAIPELVADGATFDGILHRSAERARIAVEAGDRRRSAPAERRRAVIRVLETWREVGRDLAIVGQGSDGTLRHIEALEEFRVAAAALDRAAVLRSLERLDGLIVAIEAYANPDLAMDAFVLAWPRARQAA